MTTTNFAPLQLPDGEIALDEQTRATYGVNDYTQEITTKVMPDAVVFATTIADVQATVKFAATHQIAVVPQGAKTSIVNSAAALTGSLVLNLSHMNKILAIDPKDQVAVVQPGVLNGDLDTQVRQVGYFYAPDPGSKPISSIGGNIATNAGGMSSLKYGTTKQSVLGLKVVLANGELLTLGGKTFKNNAAYDLTDLMIGSEGTLGIIVEATVRLLPIALGQPVTGLATFPTIHELMQAVQAVQASGVNPSMLEILNRVSIEALDEYEGSHLGSHGEQALLIFQIDVAAADALSTVEQVLHTYGATKIDVTEDQQRTSEIIKIRQDIFAAGAQYGRLIVEDVAVPLGQLAKVADKAETLASKYDQRLLLLGHAGDGNLHPDIILEDKEGALPEKTQRFIDELLAFVIQVGGTISAEHGIGSLKNAWVPNQLDANVRILQKQIKQVFDPLDILNPGRKI
ncbi:FAD-binding protein [Weissella hellenica]|nr:FAD-binding protein [Weissella hellenica]